MSELQLSESIVPRKLALQGRTVVGAISISTMRRLADSLCAPADEAQVELHFSADAVSERAIVPEKEGKGRTFIFMQGQVSAEVSLICQRCLEPMVAPLSTHVAVGFISDEREVELLPVEFEPYLLKEEQVALADLVEDELILALPVVAMHSDTDCQVWYQESEERSDDIALAADRENPFAVLSKLKL